MNKYNRFYCKSCGKFIEFIKRKVEYGQYIPTCPINKETEINGECKVGDCKYYCGEECKDNICLFIYCSYIKRKRYIDREGYTRVWVGNER